MAEPGLLNRSILWAPFFVGLLSCRVYDDPSTFDGGAGGASVTTGSAGSPSGPTGTLTTGPAGGSTTETSGGGGAGSSTGGAGPGAGGAATGDGGAGGAGGSRGGGGIGTGGRGAGGAVGGQGAGGRGGGGTGGGGQAGMGIGGSIGGGGSTGGAPIHDGGVDASVTGAAFVVGTFAKPIAAGAQSIRHTLGRAPKALLVWTVGATSEAPASDAVQSVGVSDGPGSSLTSAMSSRSGVSPSSSSRRIAPKAISIARWDLMTLAEADLTAWDETSFTLDWTTNVDTSTYPLHYAIIGGDSVMAKVVSWQTPTSASVKAVAGVGFMPEVVVHLHSGWFFTATPPATITNAGFGLGMMDRAGGQCAIHVRASDMKNPTLTARAQRTDASVYMTHEVGPIVTKQASFVSMDADGFTMNFTTSNSSASQIASLALGGVRAKVGAFMKTTGAAPSVQAVAGAGMKPGLVLLSSVQDTVESAITADQMRFGLGAADGSHAAASALFDTNGLATSSAGSMDFSDTAFAKSNNVTGTVDARATVQSLDADGFTLDWTVNDAVPTQLCYVALGAR